MYTESTMFPMMGIGVFNIMFWTGFVVGHNIGFSCDAMLLNALLFGGLGSYAVVKLERFTKGERRPHPSKKPPAKDEKNSNIPAHPIKPVMQAW